MSTFVSNDALEGKGTSIPVSKSTYRRVIDATN